VTGLASVRTAALANEVRDFPRSKLPDNTAIKLVSNESAERLRPSRRINGKIGRVTCGGAELPPVAARRFGARIALRADGIPFAHAEVFCVDEKTTI
jgi:hypothetical protein